MGRVPGAMTLLLVALGGQSAEQPDVIVMSGAVARMVVGVLLRKIT